MTHRRSEVGGADEHAVDAVHGADRLEFPSRTVSTWIRA
jgi:hypothetical protein